MKKLIILILFVFISCDNINVKYEKPFTITGKYVGDQVKSGFAEFNYQDKNGKNGRFKDRIDNYKVGDVIK